MEMKRLAIAHEALLADFNELRRDFDVIVQCLEGQSIQVDKHIRWQRAVRAGATLESALQHQAVATRIFAAAGQVAWSTSQRVSRTTAQAATAVQREKLIVIGGMEMHSPKKLNDCPRNLEIFDIHSGRWEAPQPMHTPRFVSGAAVLGGYLYVCGGFPEMGTSVQRYNPLKFSAAEKWWTPMPNLKRSRNYCAVVALHRHLYVMGGTDGSQVWSSMERIDPSDNDHGAFEWVHNGMRQRRHTHAAVVLQSRIYICGGCTTLQSEDMNVDMARSAEVFSPGSHESAPLPQMVVARYSHAAAVVKDKVVVSGGGIPGKHQSVNSVEVYAPSVGCWALCPEMDMVGRRGAHLSLLAAGKLYVIGGIAEDIPACPGERSMQCLDVEAHQWEEQPPMQIPRMCCCGAVVKMGPSRCE